MYIGEKGMLDSRVVYVISSISKVKTQKIVEY